MTGNVKVIDITPELILDFIKSGRGISSNVPSGAKVTAIDADQYRNVVRLYVEDASFEPIPEGSVVPRFEVRMTHDRVE